MSLAINSRRFLPTGDTRSLLIKWVVGLLVPVAVFTFIWSGEEIINNILLGIFSPANSLFDTATVIQDTIFVIIFYGTTIALVGYLVAADSGHRGTLEVWIDILVFALVPILLFIIIGNLIIGLAACAVIWPLYFFIRGRVRKARNYTPPTPFANLNVLNTEQQSLLVSRARLGGFWFATAFALVWLIADIIFFALGTLPTILLVWVVVRTILLPVAGYFLGQIGGRFALRRTITPKTNTVASVESAEVKGPAARVSRRAQLAQLSSVRATEEAKDLVPNDLPLRSTGAQRFYLTLLAVFVLFYPAIDPILFGFGSNGRLSGYGDLGYYIILALGLNIVVGFAGLLDLGYVAFFAIGSYAWGLVGSTQLEQVLGIIVKPTIWPFFFWPMLLIGALIAALWGVILGAPTLRLRGDYLAIVTLGFGEIVPIIFLNLPKITNGPNGIVGVFPPKLFGFDWSSFTPIPFYYLILALIALCIFANVRLRDSRLGRAWVAIREDEIAASSSGINLSNTKLLAFGAGAFFSGIAGVYHAAKLGNVTPDSFSYSDSIIYLAMVVIGGLGSIPGVIVGAIAVYSINLLILAQLDSIASDPGSFLHVLIQIFPNFTFGSIRNLLFGTILVVIMIFRPEGLIPSARRRRELHKETPATESIEVGALDVPPGAPGFESEIHVD